MVLINIKKKQLLRHAYYRRSKIIFCNRDQLYMYNNVKIIVKIVVHYADFIFLIILMGLVSAHCNYLSQFKSNHLYLYKTLQCNSKVQLSRFWIILFYLSMYSGEVMPVSIWIPMYPSLFRKLEMLCFPT